MPHHCNVLIVCGGSTDYDREWPSLEDIPDDLCAEVDPMPEHLRGDVPGANPPWLEWAKEHWGTKWGTYETKARELCGDGRFGLIETQCAWGPPHEKCRGKIESWLQETYGFTQFQWVIADPFDDEIEVIRVDYL